ncbi:hypothetical protein FACS1894154_08620 [Betaproteobacteria bacterium]|nr:hypothetical protein FACS1894154_08620 [Betaproteobacteria bacterium]
MQSLPKLKPAVNIKMEKFCMQRKIIVAKKGRRYNAHMPTKPQPRRKITWRVRVLMAERGVRSVSELARRLEQAGVSISIAQLGRLIDGKTRSWNQEVIEGMLVVLDCELADLWRSEMA